jgi:cytosine deaminase
MIRTEQPMLDLLVRNANLADGREGVDIAIAADRIVEVRPGITAPAAQTLDAAGQLVSPPFVDAHFHLDSVLTYGSPRVNRSGTLLEGIALWGELKPTLTAEAIAERALAYCDWAVARGLLAIRSHVDTSDPSLRAVEALLTVKKRVAPYLDLQLVAFPQDGVLRAPGALTNLRRALDMGVDVVGGIPHFERTMAQGAESVRVLCEEAAQRGLRVDMHCDETDDPASRHVETLAAETVRLGLQGRVTGSHLTSMHSMDNYYVSKLLPLMAEARLAAVANPLINITLQGRHDTYPKRRGMTRVPELLAAGVDVAFGHDCVMDPWYSLGSADMLEVAHMGLHVAQMTSVDAMAQCFAAITTTPARILGLERYGIAPDHYADFVLLQAGNPAEAIRLGATRLAVVRRGKVIARSPASTAMLDLPGRPKSVDFRR